MICFKNHCGTCICLGHLKVNPSNFVMNMLFNCVVCNAYLGVDLIIALRSSIFCADSRVLEDWFLRSFHVCCDFCSLVVATAGVGLLPTLICFPSIPPPLFYVILLNGIGNFLVMFSVFVV